MGRGSPVWHPLTGKNDGSSPILLVSAASLSNADKLCLFILVLQGGCCMGFGFLRLLGTDKAYHRQRSLCPDSKVWGMPL